MASVLRVDVRDGNPNKLKGKKKRQLLHKCQQEGFGSMLYTVEGHETLSVFDPFPLIATVRITLDLRDVTNGIRNPNMIEKFQFKPLKLLRSKPKGRMKMIEATSHLTEVNGIESSRRDVNTMLIGSEFEGLKPDIINSDVEDPLGLPPSMMSDQSKKDLFDKMTLMNPNALPFQGANLLETISRSCVVENPIFHLLLSLEICPHDVTTAITTDCELTLGIHHYCE